MQNKEIFDKIISQLKPNGTLAFTLWGDNINDVEIGEIVDKYIGYPITPIEQLNKSNVPLTTPKDIEDYLKSAGLRNVNIKLQRQEILYNCEEDFLKWIYPSLFNITMEKIKTLGEDVFSKFEEDFLNMLRTHKTKDGVLIIWDIIYASCQK